MCLVSYRLQILTIWWTFSAFVSIRLYEYQWDVFIALSHYMKEKFTWSAENGTRRFSAATERESFDNSITTKKNSITITRDWAFTSHLHFFQEWIPCFAFSSEVHSKSIRIYCKTAVIAISKWVIVVSFFLFIVLSFFWLMLFFFSHTRRSVLTRNRLQPQFSASVWTACSARFGLTLIEMLVCFSSFFLHISTSFFCFKFLVKF